jgi:hypothetical protein
VGRSHSVWFVKTGGLALREVWVSLAGRFAKLS